MWAVNSNNLKQPYACRVNCICPQDHVALVAVAEGMSLSEVVRSLKLDNVWIFVQLICRPSTTENQLYKNPNISKLETSHYPWSLCVLRKATSLLPFLFSYTRVRRKCALTLGWQILILDQVQTFFCYNCCPAVSRNAPYKMLCTYCSRPAVTTCESGCGQRFCDYVEHQEVHRDAGGRCHPFLVKEADGVGRWDRLISGFKFESTGYILYLQGYSGHGITFCWLELMSCVLVSI